EDPATGTWKEESTLTGHTDWVRDLSWAPSLGLSTSYLASCSQDKTVQIWTQENPTAAWTRKSLKADAFPDVVWRVSWSTAGNILAVSCGDNKVTMWKENLEGEFAQIGEANEAIAFFYLLSILLSSAFWFAASNSLKANVVFSLCVAIALQEAGRVGFWWLIKLSVGFRVWGWCVIPELGLTKLSGLPASLNRLKFSYSAGLGYGIMSGLVLYVTQLANSSDPGVIYCRSCPTQDMFFISALTTCIFIFLHTTWGILTFDSLWNRQRWQIPYVVASHFGASYATTLIPSN
ncbi:GTPase-activating protein S13, partial [Podochytrium sp. JEL0797]